MFISLLLTVSILILGILESYYHEKRIKNIPIRIHVNGTRGKSTTVRLCSYFKGSWLSDSFTDSKSIET
jgi:UDP-N-acetylmuramoylalanine-D-glutamate ligase